VNRFRRISILRDQALLLDVEVEGRILRRESPYFQIPVIRADDEEDLRRRLREIDGYCRQNSIRHLKAFGSILGDRSMTFARTATWTAGGVRARDARHSAGHGPHGKGVGELTDSKLTSVQRAT